MDYKSFKNQPLVYVSLFFSGGILFNRFFHLTWLSLTLFLFSGVILILNKKDRMFLPFLLSTIFGGGWFYSSTVDDKIKTQLHAATYFEDQEIYFKGEIIELVKQNENVRINIKKALIKNDSTALNCGIFIYLTLPFKGKVGDFLVGQGKFLLMRESRNPGEMDCRKYYSRKNIFGRIFLEDSSTYKIIPARDISWNSLIKSTGDWIGARFNKLIGTKSGLLISLILGNRSSLDLEIRKNFRDSGVIHVLAVSGLHLGYVLLILVSVIRIFPIPWGWDKLVLIAGLIFYIFLSGARPSVIRAGIMAVLYIMAPVLNRRACIWNVVGMAAFCMLMNDPAIIIDPGFLLSISAVISILLFYGRFNELLPEKFKVINIENRFLKFFWILFLVSLSAQLGTLPLIAYYFHRIPLIGLLANLFVVPLTGLLVATGFMILFFGWIPLLGTLLGKSAAGISEIILELTRLFPRFSFAVIQIPPADMDFIPSLIIIILGVLLIIPIQKRKIFLFALIIVNLWIWRTGFKTRTMDVIFLDVGQGDAVVIKLQSGKTMLIDAGRRNLSQDYGKRVVLPALEYLGIKHLTWAVMTHPHNDHIGGFITIEEEMKVDTLWDTYLNYDSWTYKFIIEKFSKNGTVISRLSRGEIKKLDEFTTLMVLAPDSIFVNTDKNVNNSSIVFKIVHGETTILFTGDMEKVGDIHLSKYGDHLNAEILKVAHHGSITSTSQLILDRISPQLAFVSVGKSNRFGHPSNLVLKRLKKAGVKIHRSDKSGALWIRSNGKKYWIKEWK
ncbi:MAG: DNA internalization-related competence protein ComEC/Rec2 [Candidatus Neomarinimicrobiota bacterium]